MKGPGGYRPSKNGHFLEQDGAAASDGAGYCNIKLCFVATDREALLGVLDELLTRPDCYYVKLSTERRDGMYLGRVFLTDPSAVGRAWARYKSHPKVFCSVQDDDFTMPFRPLGALLEGARRARQGEVVIASAPRGDRDPVEAVHQLALGQLLRSQPRWWKPLDEATARRVLEALFGADLAHRSPQLPPHRAARAADRFVHWMGKGARYFTVPDLAERHADGGGDCDWYRLTGASHDAGVAAVNDQDAAIVWFADEG